MRETERTGRGRRRKMDTESMTHAIDNAHGHIASITELIEARNGGMVDGEELTVDQVVDRINEYPLSVEVRSDWYTPGAGQQANQPAEYRILLTTGGPALQIVGELDEYGLPTTAKLEYQDWGTPWTPYQTTTQEDQTLIDFAQQFYFGG